MIRLEEYDDIKMDNNQVELLKARYFMPKPDGTLESWKDLVYRTSVYIASATNQYVGKDKTRTTEQDEIDFFNLIYHGKFIPATPFLMNAGTKHPQLFSCFVLDIDDNLESIYDAVKLSARIFSRAGGVGFNFSNLRPSEAKVCERNESSGVLSFMKLFDLSCETIKGGASGRRGAMLAGLDIHHPEIIDFITSKRDTKDLNNFNISTLITDDFMAAVKMGGKYKLKKFKHDDKIKKIDATKIYKELVHNAWKTGEPGILFVDSANRYNPVPSLGKIICSNPCGEILTIKNGVCCLGHVNLTTIVEEGVVNWDELEHRIRIGVRFLDNAIDVNEYPHQSIEDTERATRDIGLGFTGLADLFSQLRLVYGSTEGNRFLHKFGKFFQKISHDESIVIAQSRGAYPAFEGKTPLRRNANCSTVAPTGSTAMIVNSSYGMEPYFALAYIKKCMDGAEFRYSNQFMLKDLRELGIAEEEIQDVILPIVQETGMLPKDIKDKLPYYVTAQEIRPKDRIKVQAILQKYIDLSISSTINLPSTATEEDVSEIYMYAWEKDLKGLTVYRDGCRNNQVININSVRNTWTCPQCGHIVELDAGADPESICIKCPTCSYKSCA